MLRKAQTKIMIEFNQPKMATKTNDINTKYLLLVFFWCSDFIGSMLLGMFLCIFEPSVLPHIRSRWSQKEQYFIRLLSVVTLLAFISPDELSYISISILFIVNIDSTALELRKVLISSQNRITTSVLWPKECWTTKNKGKHNNQSLSIWLFFRWIKMFSVQY